MSAWRTWQWLCALLVMLAGVGFVGTATAAAAASSSVSSASTQVTTVALYDDDTSSNSAETTFGTAPSDAAARVANGALVAASTGEVSAPPAVFVAAETADGAANAANGVRLGQQLARELANSAFTASDELQQSAIAGS